MKNIRIKKIAFLLAFTCCNLFAQSNLKQLLKKYNKQTIPYIYVENLQKISNDITLLDAREMKEFETSHIINAQFVGYEKFNLKKTIQKLPNKNARIVVYCSLGVRSEDIAEKLKSKGYLNVQNLYGGIFEWKNKGNDVYSKGSKTEKVHAFSQEWGKWLLKGEKVYE